MNTSKLIAFLCFLFIVSCKENNTVAQSAPEKKVRNELLTATDYESKINDKNVQLIDVRTPKEYSEGHLKNAKNIDFFAADFYDQMGALNKDAPLYIYCRSGNRSGKAAGKLEALGFKEIYDLKGGILNWKQRNLEVVQ